MNIASTNSARTSPSSPIGTRPNKAKPDSPEPFEPGVDQYCGPADGKSRPPRFPHAKKAVLTAGNSLFRRLEVEGKENLPLSGKHVYSPNHISILDVPIVANLGVKDMRILTDIDVFCIPGVARLAGLIGCFPVNRNGAHPATKAHTLDIIRKEGVGLAVFPEGGYNEDPAKIAPFHMGAAAAAVLGEADTLVPLAIHREKNKELRSKELLAGVLAGAGVMSLGVVLTGVPIFGAVAGAVSGGLTGAFTAGLAAKSLMPDSHSANPAKDGVTILSRAAGALAGAATGALVGAATGPMLAFAGGLSTLGLANAWRTRDVVRVKIGEGIDMSSYQEKAQTDKSAAIRDLTTALHRRVGQLKSELSGVPYDPNSQALATAPLPARF